MVVSGKPALDNKTVLNNNAKILLDLLNKFKCVNTIIFSLIM